MLDKEDEHCLIEHIGITETGLDGAAAFEVHDVERQVPVHVTVTEQLIAEVNVLAIHEIVLVKQSHLEEGLAPQEAESTADHFYATWSVPRQPAHVVATTIAEIFADRKSVV